MKMILYWLIVINLSSAVICIFDKLQAKRGGMRIPERYLFGFSIFGGSIGTYITMLLIRHKTKHKRFMIGLPIIIFIQCLVLIWFLHIMRTTA